MIRQIKNSVPDELSEEYLSAKSIFLAVALWRSFGGEIQIQLEEDLSVFFIDHAWLFVDGHNVDIDGSYEPIITLNEGAENLYLGLDEPKALEVIRSIIEVSDKEWEKEVKKALKIVKQYYFKE